MRRLLEGVAAMSLLLAGGLSAQVANGANAGYKTPEGRKAVAQGLADPARDQSMRPGQLIGGDGAEAGHDGGRRGNRCGLHAAFLSRRVGAAGHVIGGRHLRRFSGQARQRAEKQNLTNVTFVKGTETDPNLPEGKMDEVLVLDAYHHFDYPEKMLAAIHKVAEAGRASW